MRRRLATGFAASAMAVLTVTATATAGPFKMSCARHDFGYRNHKAAGTFSANKARLDSALHEDLKRVCNGYGGATKTACNSTAWTYYQAVKAFG
ncbi:phospholipase A2 [Streptomyces collinus]|uniref:phospholipase A2 n=1 Tax=Streptomyces collinus TaxID=42684 RepID=UPI0033CCE699